MKEVKCYALEVIFGNIENFKDEIQYIMNSFKANKGFVGVHVTKDNRTFAMFRTPLSRNECYNRINNHFDEMKQRVAIVLETAHVEEQYIFKN